MEHEKFLKSKVPTHLTVTIELKWIDSIKDAKLEINESTLLFEYPNVYYLDVNLKYKVDKDSGNAKFDKKKKTLSIKLPVIGLNEDSQKVLDAHY
jgi:NACalpha-BTF3-like transcription factor